MKTTTFHNSAPFHSTGTYPGIESGYDADTGVEFYDPRKADYDDCVANCPHAEDMRGLRETFCLPSSAAGRMAVGIIVGIAVYAVCAVPVVKLAIHLIYAWEAAWK